MVLEEDSDSEGAHHHGLTLVVEEADFPDAAIIGDKGIHPTGQI